MEIVAVAGFAGSGKTTFLNELARAGYEIIDDIGRDDAWQRNLRRAREMAHEGRKVAISDVEFCDPRKREGVERSLELPIRWVYFANDPWQCAKNCLYRYLFEQSRPLTEEIRTIRRLSAVYGQPVDARPVYNCDDKMPFGAPRPVL